MAASRLHVVIQKILQVTRHLPFLGFIKVSLPPIIVAKVLELNRATQYHVVGKISTVLDPAEVDKQVACISH